MNTPQEEAMWYALNTKNIELFKSALWGGADPDNKRRMSEEPNNRLVTSVIDYICDCMHDSDEENGKFIEVCFDYGANWDYNAKLNYAGSFLNYAGPFTCAVLLAQMAYHAIKNGERFTLPIDQSFGMIGSSFQDDETSQTVRQELAENIYLAQHQFVDYVRTSNNEAAVFLREIPEHPDSKNWLEKIEFPDHTRYSRPHPEIVTAATHLREITEEYYNATGPSGQEVRHYLYLEGQKILKGIKKAPPTWRPPQPT